MTRGQLPVRAGVVLALTLMLAACGPASHRPTSAGAQPQAKPAPASEAADKTGQAVAALWRGDTKKAEKLLRRVLKKTPDDPKARKLMQQINEDPRKLLGGDSYAYRVKLGETLWGLSQRMLDDPLLFYALARYNDIAVPQALAAGRLIQIPGTVHVEAPAPKPVEKPAPQPVAAPPPPPPPPPPAPPPPPPDPVRANKLRTAGLAAMSKGAIDHAVVLLQQAQQADPASALVARDLGRARKIQAAVHRR
jgi:hypothetical protein